MGLDSERESFQNISGAKLWVDQILVHGGEIFGFQEQKT